MMDEADMAAAIDRAVAKAVALMPAGGGVAAAFDGGRHMQAGVEGVNGAAIFGDGVGAGFAGGAAGDWPRPWDMVWATDGTVSFVNPAYRRGPVFKYLADVTGVTIVADAEYSWVGAEISTVTGLCTRILSGSKGDATFEEVPEDPEFDRLPLYKLRRVGSGETATWDVEIDLRSMGLVLYV
jgi:hypothetical protein